MSVSYVRKLPLYWLILSDICNSASARLTDWSHWDFTNGWFLILASPSCRSASAAPQSRLPLSAHVPLACSASTIAGGTWGPQQCQGAGDWNPGCLFAKVLYPSTGVCPKILGQAIRRFSRVAEWNTLVIRVKAWSLVKYPFIRDIRDPMNESRCNDGFLASRQDPIGLLALIATSEVLRLEKHFS